METYVLLPTRSKKPPPLRLILKGSTGICKSTLIECMVRMVIERQGLNTIKVIAPTGCAGFDIQESTVHSLFSMGFDKKNIDLSVNSLRKLEQKLETIKYLIIGEMSMIDKNMLRHIDKRLGERFPKYSD